MRAKFAGVLAALLFIASCAQTLRAASTEDELKELRNEVAKLRDQVNTNRTAASATMTSPVDTLMDNKYGPDAVVTARSGRLEIGGLQPVMNDAPSCRSRAGRT